MNTKDYEKAKQECLIQFCGEHLIGPDIDILVKGAFGYAFDRAYNLGMEAAKKEMLTAHVESLGLNVDNFEPEQDEPKFKVGDLCMCDGYVARVLEYIPSREFPYTVHILQMNVKTVTNGSDLESFTKPKEEMQKESKEKENNFASDNKHFDNILKDSFRSHNRMRIASMAMAGILSNESEVNRACQIATMRPQCITTPSAIAQYALACADALISESEKKGGK